MSRNLLGQETSPYLLQHKDNPVHWRPWNAQALAEAKQSGKPILLSIGYAACHWCHVMAHESFENADTARLMNDLFIPIKVDREERPDLDAIYQASLSMLGQRGGWPLTMFLTPDGEPFWGGTYFPPRPRYGMAGFPEILGGVHDAWTHQQDKIAGNVSALKDALARQATAESGEDLNLDLLDQAARSLLRSVDMRHGGLRGAPKFPHAPLFALMWRAHRRTGEPALKDAVLLTLERMSQGGIYDHLGGGYARYSTDEEWLAPHFEKMLYDNAQLVELLTEVALDADEPLFARRVSETIGWLLREMLAEGRAFAATLDADSEGEEGKFYVWRAFQIEEALPKALYKPFAAAYDVSAGGNWEGHVILNLSRSQPLTPHQEELMAEARQRLLAVRENRVRPGRDDKILADWNGMMIAALVKAAFAFDRPDWLVAAETAFDAVARLLGKGDRLSHCYRQGRALDAAMLDDYAQIARAALALFEVTGRGDYLAQAERWIAQADALYWDVRDGGYFFTAADAGDLIVRTKTALDNATPSGNGVMVEVLARLFLLTGRESYRQRAEETVMAFSGDAAQSFPNMATLMNGWDVLTAARQLVIVGKESDPQRRAMLRLAAEKGGPSLVLCQLYPGQELPASHPARGKTAVSRATAYLCTGQSCGLPVYDAPSLAKIL
ncbi:MAG TPA: thioredoxin domain-containing protein [Candidatus Sulfotelmatobacter sp.]|jgi:uncharacterized protein YyaL (SSP411 family)|nr:thioredoxin domain-containing protein [Candidatus Sulfotelmatobacter sp.]